MSRDLETGIGIELQKTDGGPTDGVRILFDGNAVDDTSGAGLDSPTAGAEKGGEKKLTTLFGVFLPCVQNILGVILFLRLPWIVGQSGMVLTTVIIMSCASITFLTTLSLSSIATNGRIRAGGPYYVISRSLGKEVGAAVGILFYLGTTIAVTMYALGAVEAAQKSFNFEDMFTFDSQLEGLALLFVMALVVTGGIQYVNRTAGIFLAVVIISILSFFIGIVLFTAGETSSAAGALKASARVTGGNMNAAFEEDPETGLTPSFISLLALFFPSVTGIMAGTNRSGMLQNPGKSIPRGTLGAILVTTTLYVTTVWLFGSTVANETLKTNKVVVSAAAWPHPMLVNVGIVMSSIGAGMQSMTGAPQLLAAIAADNVLPRTAWLVPKDGKGPTRAVWVTWFIAALAALPGNLDFITPIVSMMFLLMYGMVNLACFLFAVTKPPFWRPTWRYFHWSTAGIGFLACISFMLVISWYSALVAIVLASAIFALTKFTDAETDWGDVWQGVRFQIARDSLLAMAAEKQSHAKNWRPQLLVACSVTDAGRPIAKHENLLDFASQLKKGRGIALVTGLLRKPNSDMVSGEVIERARCELQLEMQRRRMKGFASVLSTSSMREGVRAAVQGSGLGPMQANAVVMPWVRDVEGGVNWRDDPAVAEEYVRTLRAIHAAQRSVFVIKTLPGELMPTVEQRMSGTIDVWWIVHDGGLLLMVPYLLSLHRVWRGCKVRLFAVATTVSSVSTLKGRVVGFLESSRIAADVNVVVLPKDEMEDIKRVNQRTLDVKKRQELFARLQNELGDSVVPTLTTAARGDTGVAGGATFLRSLFDDGPASPAAEAKQDDAPQSAAEAEAAAARAAGETTPQVAAAAAQAESLAALTETSAEGAPPAASEDAAAAAEGEEETEADSARKRRVGAAMRLNKRVLAESKEASLVVMNMPIARTLAGHEVLEYVDLASAGLRRVVLVQGSGVEVVTKYV